MSEAARRERVVVVGAGVGGLVAALWLAADGLDVTVLEAADAPGGKLQAQPLAGTWLDAGPTVFTMRWVFDALAARLGKRLDDALPLAPLNTLARHTWRDGSQLDLFADFEATVDAIGRFAGAADARGFRAFSARARAQHDTLLPSFMNAQQPNPLSLSWRVATHGLAGLGRISPFGSMWDGLGRYFHDPRLRQLFGRYATYCGSSPLLAPATLMLVAHVEQQGVWSVPGGMHRLASTLASWLAELGVPVRCGARVSQLRQQGGRISGVVLASGEVLPARCVVFNGDVSALAAGHLGPTVQRAAPAVPPQRRSLSAITWTAVLPRVQADLLRHNVYFSDDSPQEFNELFAQRRLPTQPTVYLCAQDRENGHAPSDTERLLCLVNAPADGDRADAAADADACEQRMLAQLAQCGLQLPWQEGTVQRSTPHDFERRYPGSGGALYGRASHGWQASFARAGARCALPGLYLAGGGVHPGPGVPMAALSGQRAAECVAHDLGLAGHRRAA
jgi:1-hydroxycarotenoid 3,4-desaturase